MRHLLAAALAATLAAPASLAAPPLPPQKGSMPAAVAPVTRLIVKLRPEATTAQARGATARATAAARVAALAAGSGVRLGLARQMSGDAVVVDLPEAASPAAAEALARRLEGQAGVEYAVPDYWRRPLGLPSDTYFLQQWALQAPTTSIGGQVAVGGANLPLAWDISTGSNTTVVAILDTGVLPHPEISARLLPGYDFVSNLFVANDGDLRDADASDPGDWVSDAEADIGYCAGQAATPSIWHGTAVAGVVAAAGNNGSDIAGVNWQTRLLPVRVLGKCGGYDSDIIDGIRWAAGLAVAGAPANPYPADVLNLSLGATTPCTAAYVSAFADVHAAGVTVVAASGNESAYSVSSPGNCPNVIAVTAHAMDGTSAIYANVGSEVALSAPGGGPGTSPTGHSTTPNPGLLTLYNAGSTTPTTGYTLTTLEGTSFAAPQVAGAAALVRALLPTADPDTIRSLLTLNVRNFPAGSWCTLSGKPLSGKCGAGLLDVNRVVRAAATLAGISYNHAPTASSGGTLTGTAGKRLVASLYGADADADPLTWSAITLPPGATLSAAGQFTWNKPVAGTFALTYSVSDGQASSGPVSLTVNIAPAPAAPSGGGGGGGAGAPFLLLLALGALRAGRARRG